LGIFLIISICITSDIGGYIVGNIVKGKKLTKISPKKTYYGKIGTLIFSFYTTFALRNDIDEKSYVFFIIVLTICISTDIGGYFFGKLFKGPKLTKISPKKTYSGMIGSFIFSLIISSILFKDLVSIQTLIIFIFLISLISQTGDILISLLKRTAKLKDTGNILPGHGGLLDRFDGLFFAIPLGFMISRYLW